MEQDTIYALSSGMPPAAIAVLRISGPRAGAALEAMAGGLPKPRRARLATLRDPRNGDELDRALLLWFPGPGSATGEDLAEIHAHGGRAVVRALENALSRIAGLRPAIAGEFTRRALVNGRMDLAEAEGLADLLASETESQRRQAQALAGGGLSRVVSAWTDRLVALAARVEALLDFSDEDDVAEDDQAVVAIVTAVEELAAEMAGWLARPPVERLHDGISVAIAGPPNAGKSTLLNALAGRDAAIVSPHAGTTRDVVEVPLTMDGVPFRLADTAGLNEGTTDPVEAMGIERARSWAENADLLLWLGEPAAAPDRPGVCRVAAQADRAAEISGWPARLAASDMAVSARNGEGLDELRGWLLRQARSLLPAEGEVALNRRQRDALVSAVSAVEDPAPDLLLLAEDLRHARGALDRVTGRAGTEAMLDALFSRFCIGK